MPDIRRRVLTALALDRTPGFNYSGNLLGVRFEHITCERARLAMDQGPYVQDPQGEADIAAVCLLADICMGTVVRANLTPEQRLATVSLTLQFTGAPRVGALAGRGEFESFARGADSTQGLCRASVWADGKLAIFGQGAFMVMNPPPGRTMYPLVSADHAAASPLREDELDAQEQHILARATQALQATGNGRGFLRHFWGFLPQATADGALCRVTNGPHVGNRVGHLQGGLQLGMAILTAEAALPAGWVTSGISAFFLSPGQGDDIVATATVQHLGRNTAVVRTLITGLEGRTVLEAVTTHLRRA